MANTKKENRLRMVSFTKAQMTRSEHIIACLKLHVKLRTVSALLAGGCDVSGDTSAKGMLKVISMNEVPLRAKARVPDDVPVLDYYHAYSYNVRSLILVFKANVIDRSIQYSLAPTAWNKSPLRDCTAVAGHIVMIVNLSI